jgi:hypothetical protein
MGNLATDDKAAVALGFMKRAARDAFKVCAKSAEDMADQIESGALPRRKTWQRHGLNKRSLI